MNNGEHISADPSPIVMALGGDCAKGHKKITNLATELLGLQQMLTALAGPKVKLRLLLEGCPDGEVSIEHNDLTKILINLVRNASEAIPANGNISISLAASYEGAAPSIVLAVEDDGLAIPLAQLECVFETEATHAVLGGSESSRRPVRSRRLGLRIVRELAEAAGGKVRAVRMPERGSRMEIILPIANCQTEAAMA